MFKVGTVVVTQSGSDWKGRLIGWSQKSIWTHVFIVTGEDTFVESQPETGVVERPLAAFMAQLKADGRLWIALDLPALTDEQRAALTAEARSFVGRRYDYLQALLWFFTHGFWYDGEMRLICSRLITACYRKALPGFVFFPEAQVRALPIKRQEDLRNGYCTPLTILEFSALQIVSMSPGAWGALFDMKLLYAQDPFGSASGAGL